MDIFENPSTKNRAILEKDLKTATQLVDPKMMSPSYAFNKDQLNLHTPATATTPDSKDTTQKYLLCC